MGIELSNISEEANILVVYDNQQEAFFLEKLLSSEGYKVWLAEDSRKAMEVLRNNNIIVVIADPSLKGFDGFQLTRVALNKDSAISVLLLSHYSMIPQAVKVMEEGAYGFITRPLNEAEVKIMARRAVEHTWLLLAQDTRDDLAELSIKDGLTGIYNKRFLDLFLPRRISEFEKSGSQFSLIMGDIDFFKAFNDTNGHLEGDKLLKSMGSLLSESLRKDDAVFRYGGEEFVVYLSQIGKSGAMLIAERLRNSIPLYLNVTMSMGVAAFPEDGRLSEDILARVDAALYFSKATGRNKVTMASPEIKNKSNSSDSGKRR